MIDARKCPRISDPVRQEGDDGCSLTDFRQRCAITESDFHFRRRQRTGKPLSDPAVRAVGRNQIATGNLDTGLRTHHPCVVT